MKRRNIGPRPTTLLEVAILVTIVVLMIETIRQRLPNGIVDVPFFKNDLSLEFWALLGILWAADRWTGAGSALYGRGGP